VLSLSVFIGSHQRAKIFGARIGLGLPALDTVSQWA